MATSKGRGKTHRARQAHLQKVQWPGDGDDMAMRNALAMELLAACMTALKTYGLREPELAKLARKAVMGNSASMDIAKSVLQAAQQLAEMIAKWGEHPTFLDASGRPAVLNIIGRKPSFTSLANEFFPKYSVTDVVDFGCQANAMERVGPDKVARLNDCVVFTGNSFLILAHSVRTVRRFLSTANFNRQRRIAIAAGRPDRTSCGEISDIDLSEFSRVMRPQISGVVEMSNRWLAQRAKVRRSGSRTRGVAGVQAFLFFD